MGGVSLRAASPSFPPRLNCLIIRSPDPVVVHLQMAANSAPSAKTGGNPLQSNSIESTVLGRSARARRPSQPPSIFDLEDDDLAVHLEDDDEGALFAFLEYRN